MNKNVVIKKRFVAFLDILGFSSMIKSDFIKYSGGNPYYSILRNAHAETNKFAKQNNLELLQFSDSVVLTSPFNKNNLVEFIYIVKSLQYNLFKGGVLCRGGISYGKHIFEEGFLYSYGMLEAYELERNIARYPRIVISSDLVDMAVHEWNMPPRDIPIIRENDGVCFVDFIRDQAQKEVSSCFKKFFSHQTKSTEPGVSAKIKWLSDYIAYKYPDICSLDNRFDSFQ